MRLRQDHVYRSQLKALCEVGRATHEEAPVRFATPDVPTVLADLIDGSATMTAAVVAQSDSHSALRGRPARHRTAWQARDDASRLSRSSHPDVAQDVTLASVVVRLRGRRSRFHGRFCDGIRQVWSAPCPPEADERVRATVQAKSSGAVADIVRRLSWGAWRDSPTKLRSSPAAHRESGEPRRFCSPAKERQ